MPDTSRSGSACYINIEGTHGTSDGRPSGTLIYAVSPFDCEYRVSTAETAASGLGCVDSGDDALVAFGCTDLNTPIGEDKDQIFGAHGFDMPRKHGASRWL